MNLNDTDIKRFYHIWFNILEYVNENFNIVPELKNIHSMKNVNPQDIQPIRERLWRDDSILDDIVNKNPFNLSISDLNIVESWKYRISDKFIIMKHLKKYTVMMGNKRLYGVLGIVTPLCEMFPTYRIPLFVEAVLIPFEGKIIYDSILAPYNITFGSGSRRGFNDEYREIKNKFGIINTL